LPLEAAMKAGGRFEARISESSHLGANRVSRVLVRSAGVG